MLDDRQGGRERKRGRREFRPGLDGRVDHALESRCLLSSARVAAEAKTLGNTRNVDTQVAFGGKVAMIRDTDLELYNVAVVGNGRVRAKPMSGGRVMLIVDGSDSNTVLAVNPEARQFRRGTAHEFPPRAAAGDGLLHVGKIKVASGKIGQILAYRTADLSGPIVVSGTSPVERIAFFSYKPGASIVTGGDLNTLDSFNDLSLGGGPGIAIGRDLNWMLVGGNLTVSDGSSFLVTRDIGLTFQAAKGTDPGGQGAHVQGNLDVDATSSFVVGRSLVTTFLVDGTIGLVSSFQIPANGNPGNFVARGGFVG